MSNGQKYWEMIADDLKSNGWSVGWIQFERNELLLWQVDAHQGDERHLASAEDILTAFIELAASVYRLPRV